MPPGVQQALDSAKGAIASGQRAIGFWDGLRVKWSAFNKSIENTIGFSPASVIGFIFQVIIWILNLAVTILQYVIKGLQFIIDRFN